MRKELLVFLAFMFLQCGVQAQCPIINMAMVNSCGAAEGPNEFLAFTTTAATTVGSYKLYYGSNNPPSSPTNTLSGAAARTQSGTGSIVATGCNIIYVTNSTTIIPTDSRVVFIPADFDQKYDLSALCYGGNIYVVFIDRTGSTPTWSPGGNFSNDPNNSPVNKTRYIQLTNSASTCTSEIRSYKTGWSSNLDGNFVSWNSAGVATYGNNGCDFNSLPSITPQTITPICLGASAASMDFTTTGTPDKYSIVWNAAAITDGFTNITLAALTVSPLNISIPTTATATVYSGTITVTNSTTSTTSLPQSFSITINPLPATPTVNITQPTCTISTGTITVTPVAGITYSIDGINFSTTSSFTGLVQGNYTITAKSAVGCTATTTATINAPLAAPAAPTVITPITYCQNVNATALTATGANLTWYTTATATTGSAIAPIPSTTTAGSTIYYVTQTVTGCESPKAAITVQVNPLPAIPTVNITQPTCATPTGTITITPVAGITYSIDGINFSTNTSFTGLAQGNYTITAKSAAGCTSTTTATINATLTAPAAPTVITPITYCQNANATALTATGANLTWYTTATATTGSAIAPIPSTTTAGSTIYYVTQTVTGCESPKAAITVQVNPLPAIPTVNITQPTCATPTGTITITSVAGLTYSIDGTNFSTNGVYAGLTQGNYTITSKSAAGCTSTTTATINAPLAAPTAPTVFTPITYCQNATATALTATGANLTWYTTATATTGSAIAPIPSTTTAGSTIYYVTQTVTGCESPKAAITVQVSAPSASTINATICNGSSYILNGINYNAAGTYTAKLTNRAGCDSIVTLNLTVSTFKLTLITTSNPIYAGSPFAARIAGTSSIVNSYWQPPSLFINDQSQQNITAPNASFILKVLGVSANGCKDSITQPITIITPNKIVYIPNAMSPGSNGGEDVTTLKIYGSYIKSATMYIYNQWGQLIFQNENPLTIGWDGKYKGVAQPSGVYMYAVKITYLDDTKETKSGSINLIR